MIHSIKFFKASRDIKEPNRKARAELLLMLLGIRQIACSLLLLSILTVRSGNIAMMAGVCLLNLFAFGVAKSKYFEWGALIVLVEPLFAVPLTIHASLGHFTLQDPSIMSPLWLAIGPLIGSLLLSFRQTLGLMIASAISFAFIFAEVPAEFRTLLSFELLFVSAVSLLSLIGSHLREKVDVASQTERSKVLQSSKLASLGEMAGGIAHELNSPLAAIVLNIELLDEEISELQGPTDHVLRKVRSIGDIAERMAKIIDGLRKFSRDGSKEKLVSVPAREWIADSLDLCRQRFHNQGVRVHLVEDNFAIVCDVQSIQLSQTLVNLLNNAFDAISDKAEKWISIDARVNGDHFDVLITDSGNGIPKAQVDRLFEPFYTTKEIGRGTGLGLSISKGIMQNHGGDLLYDESCANTRFIMRLPMVKNIVEREVA